MRRPSMSTFMHHPDGGDGLMVDGRGTIVKTRDVQWIGVDSKHKSVYRAVLDNNGQECVKSENDTSRGVSA